MTDTVRHLANRRRVPRVVESRMPVAKAADIAGPEWVGVKSDTLVMAALRFDPEHPNYGAVRSAWDTWLDVRDNWDATVAAANGAAIQQAADDARDTGGTLVLKGPYMVDRTIHLECHVDAGGGALYVNDDSGAIKPAVLTGSHTPGTRLWRKTMSLPRIVQVAKTHDGGWSGHDVGLEISNAYSCEITIPHVRWFTEGVRMSARGAGCVYNTINVGHLDNSKIGYRIIPVDTGGWVNENIMIGGRWSINGGEGTNISGSRHILISDAPAGSSWIPDNNLFLKPSIEGNGPEFHYECFGQYNTILQARWEASLGAKAQFNGSRARRNAIVYGYGQSGVTVTQVNGAGQNWREGWLGTRYYPYTDTNLGAHYARSYMRNHGATSVMSSTASPTDHALAILYNDADHTTDAATAWRIGLSGAYLETKNTTDTAARWRVTTANGAMEWGPGNAAPDVRLSRRAAHVLGTDDGDSFHVGSGAWNGGHLIMGFVHLWFDSGGNLRKKAGAPTSETDGTVIG